MRHFLLTRMAYDPALWGAEANARRLALLQGVTARSVAAQTSDQFVWVVLVHSADPLREQRLAAVRGAVGPRMAVLQTDEATGDRARAAAHGYRAAWPDVTEARRGRVLTTRCDDDDALTPWFLERVRGAAIGYSGRAAFVIPEGWRVGDGRYAAVRHETNAWVSLLTPNGEAETVYSYNHKRMADHARVVLVEGPRGWLWVGHPDTLSNHKVVLRPIDGVLRSRFPIDWALLEGSGVTDVARLGRSVLAPTKGGVRT